jgi:hypothetical protein
VERPREIAWPGHLWWQEDVDVIDFWLSPEKRHQLLQILSQSATYTASRQNDERNPHASDFCSMEMQRAPLELVPFMPAP